MPYKDLDKRRRWQKEYYQANKKEAKKTVRQLLLEENERLKKENSELRKNVVLLICPNCKK